MKSFASNEILSTNISTIVEQYIPDYILGLQHAALIKSEILHRYFTGISKVFQTNNLPEHNGYFSVNEYKRHIQSLVPASKNHWLQPLIVSARGFILGILLGPEYTIE